MISFLKTAGKWAVVFGGIYVVALLVSDLSFEKRAGAVFLLFGLAMIYMNGTQRDRMAALESRIADLERQLNGARRQYPFDGA